MFYLLQHQAYVTNTNNLLEQYDDIYQTGDMQKIREISHAIEYNIGAHFNYEFFWESLAPIDGEEESEGEENSEEEGMDLIVINENGEEQTIRVEEG